MRCLKKSCFVVRSTCIYCNIRAVLRKEVGNGTGGGDANEPIIFNPGTKAATYGRRVYTVNSHGAGVNSTQVFRSAPATARCLDSMLT